MNKTWIKYPNESVKAAVIAAYTAVDEDDYCGTGSLTLEQLIALGVETSDIEPEGALHNVISENTNWGSRPPEVNEWFHYGAGSHYNGSCGSCKGWRWYN